MKRNLIYITSIVTVLFLTIALMNTANENKEGPEKTKTMNNKSKIILPEPNRKDGPSLEEVIEKRRSERDFKDEPPAIEDLSLILWAGQGITDKERGLRSSPSAGALYPLVFYIDIKNINGLNPGIYRYEPEGHFLILKQDKSRREEIYRAALEQNWIKEAPALIIMNAHYHKVTIKYGERGIRYTHMEAGHSSQNIYLQTTSLGLGTVAVGAFNDDAIKNILGVDSDPLYLMPIGKVK